jgi:hypothetical protein
LFGETVSFWLTADKNPGLTLPAAAGAGGLTTARGWEMDARHDADRQHLPDYHH